MDRSDGNLLEVFRHNLKRQRAESDLNQVELSRLCNFHKSYVGKIERGDVDPSLEAIQRIARELDVTILELLTSERIPEVRVRETLGSEDADKIIFEDNRYGEQGEPEQRSWYEQAPVGFLTMEPEGQIIRFNETFRGMLRYGQGKFPVNDIGALLHETDRSRFLQYLESAADRDQHDWVTFRFVTSEGDQLDCSVCSSSIQEQTSVDVNSDQIPLFESGKAARPDERIQLAIVNNKTRRES